MEQTRKNFIFGSLGLAADGALAGCRATATPLPAAAEGEDELDLWRRETDQVTADVFEAHMRGDVPATDCVSLARLEGGASKRSSARST